MRFVNDAIIEPANFEQTSTYNSTAKPYKSSMVYPVEFQREREGLRIRLPLLRRPLLLERGTDRLAKRRPDDGQVSEHLPVQLLHVEPDKGD